MATRVRLATAADFERAFGRVPPTQTWFAMVAERDGAPIGFGTVCWNEHGQACASFDRVGEVSAVTMHRTARMVMDWLRKAGEPALYVTCDDNLAGARRWLERLGFERHANGVWVKCLAT